LKHSFEILTYIRIPESQDPDSMARQPQRALRIVGGRRVLGVSSPVQLDRQHSLDTEEIEDERAERMLSPKLEPVEVPGAKSLPEDAFGGGQFPPKTTSVLSMGRGQS
jgi:hypothetical protein